MLGATRRKNRAIEGHHPYLLDPLYEVEDPDHDDDNQIPKLFRHKKSLVYIFAMMVVGALVAVVRGVDIGSRWRSTTESGRTLKNSEGAAPTNDGNIKLIAQPNDCSCKSSTLPMCCDQRILRAHKMGVVMIRTYFRGIPSEIIHPDRIELSEKDYRHVVLTRPWYDAIVSGYLYHKSGRECWLDQNGNPRAINKTIDWESNLKLKPLNPPSNGRTICSYLAEESEEDGLRAYVDFSISELYSGILPHRQLVEQVEGPSEINKNNKRTLWVCFGDLENPKTFGKTHQQVMDWLYPGKGHKPQTLMTALSGKNGHETTRATALRDRLRSLVRKYDYEYFDGIGERATKMFGCEREMARK